MSEFVIIPDTSCDLTKDTATSFAVAERNVDGAYGILIHGEKMVPGGNYYVRPYVKYNGVFSYGSAQKFVMPAPSSEI